MAAGPDTTDGGRTIGVLRRQLEAALAERDEAQAQQAAMAEVLKAINAASGDFAPVFDLIIARAMALCDAVFGTLLAYENDHLTMLAERNGPRSLVEYWRTPQFVEPTSANARVLEVRKTIQIPDLSQTDNYLKHRLPITVASVELGGIRTIVMVPLATERGSIGLFILYRQEVRPFTERQVALVEAFAAQAAMAMENARLLTEQRDALERQTATADVLSVINASPGDLAPVFEAILEKSRKLCDAAYGDLWTYDGELLHLAATQGEPGFAAWLKAQGPVPVWPGSPTEVLMKGAPFVQYEDPIRDGHYEAMPEFLAQVQRAGVQSTLFVPMWKDATLLGVIIVYRREVRRFADSQVAVLQGFAAQAVIAMENARLLTEQREALEQQTATANILRVISSSVADTRPVFDEILRSIEHLFGAEDRFIWLLDENEQIHIGAVHGPNAERARALFPVPLEGSATEITIRERRVMRYDDTLNGADVPPVLRETARRFGESYSMAIVPMLWEDRAIGAIGITRTSMRPFTDKECDLLRSFADQAIIAIQNARMFSETQEALEQQTATTEVLEVINASPGSLEPVFGAMLDKAMHLCEASFGMFARYQGTDFEMVADRGVPAALLVAGRHLPSPPAISGLGRLVNGEAVVQFVDLPNTEIYRSGFVGATALVAAGANTAIFVALRKDDVLQGAIIMYRKETRAFSDKQVALLQNFAAQAVIAMENARLITETREALEQQTATAEVLQVISQSPTDVEPVLRAVVAAARRFCGAEQADIFLREGDEIVAGPYAGPIASQVRGNRDPLDLRSSRGQTILEGRVTHIPDVQALDPGQYPMAQHYAKQFNFRATVNAPMLREGEAIGCLTLRKPEAGPFTDRQIKLLETFAAQAVIAIQNVRLFTELKESLDQQTATADILRVISQSPTDVQPVLDAVAKAAVRFCGAADAIVGLRDGNDFRLVAKEGPLAVEIGRREPLNSETSMGRSILGGRTWHLPDIMALDPVEWAAARRLAEEFGQRSVLAAPMLREGVAIGSIGLRKPEAGPFTDRQIQLLESFAAQAVIAIENVRLFTELKESLDQQTATAGILRVISESPTDVQPVLDAVAESARRFCGSDNVNIHMRDGDELVTRASASGSLTAEYLGSLLGNRIPIDRRSAAGRAILESRTVHLPNVMTLDPAEYSKSQELARGGGFNTVLCAPMIRDGEAIGVITLPKISVEPFTPRQIALLETFAAQAAIAIQNVRLFTELKESLDQQTATAEVLETINRSQGDLQPVFDAMVGKAMTLCDAPFGIMFSWDGEHLRAVSTQHAIQDQLAAFREPIKPDPQMDLARVLREGVTMQDVDVSQGPSYRRRIPVTVYIVEEIGIRTILYVPLVSERGPIGLFTLYRLEVRPFTDKQIALVEAFAQQAVVAMENARLLGELTRREEELRVTFDHMGDGVVMFDAGLQLASWNRNFQELLDIPDSFVASRPGLDDYVRLLHSRGELGDGSEESQIARFRERATYQWSSERTRPNGDVIEVRNNPVPGGGTVLIYGDITERKKAEAAIAAARDAAETALERQTATADILKVIASSPSDTQPAFEAIAQSAKRLLGVDYASVLRFEGDLTYLMAFTSMPPEAAEALKAAFPMRIADTGVLAQTAEGKVVEIPDTEAEGMPAITRENGRRRGLRAYLSVPLMAQGTAIGAVAVAKSQPGTFSPDDVQLLKTFADQAVIAIQNARLFGDLRESLEQQTATSEILQVISQSPTDVQPVLEAVARAAVRFCGATDSLVHLREGDKARLTAHEGGIDVGPVGMLLPLTRDHAVGRAIVDGAACHIPDYDALDPADWPTARALSRDHGHKAGLAVPMLREGAAVGAIMLRKPVAEPFTSQQIKLLETFAAQAVIAIENVRLFTELRDSLDRLKAAQANLVQSEKMASLGQLTAGIAHEIKNPLNFVNNFATLSVDLLDELKEAAGAAFDQLDEDKRAEIDETMELLVGNLGKIAEHGKRADGIVKSMLSHSRGGAGDWTPSDINALVEEALNLAYHGARSQDKEFNVTLERDLGKAGAPIEVVPQDVTRVFLNLFGNGFYAANKRRMTAKQAGFRPTLKVTTRDLGEMVEIKVRDNGIGMSADVREKLFQPFFTTKPTGEGTGLGLSISYDIVTQQHGGTIDVESEPDNFTEFTVRLPRARRVVAANERAERA